MKWKIKDPPVYFNLLSIVILLAGLISATWIYQTADNNPKNVLGYDEGNGSVYPIRPEDSKKYLRDLELYGGKANVLVTEFRLWFVGLWHGKSLAFTLAFITILISLAFYCLAHYRPSNSRDDVHSKNSRNRPD
jgi:hypothetical protein